MSPTFLILLYSDLFAYLAIHARKNFGSKGLVMKSLPPAAIAGLHILRGAPRGHEKRPGTLLDKPRGCGSAGSSSKPSTSGIWISSRMKSGLMSRISRTNHRIARAKKAIAGAGDQVLEDVHISRELSTAMMTGFSMVMTAAMFVLR